MVELGPAVLGFAALLVQEGWTRSGIGRAGIRGDAPRSRLREVR